MSLRTHYKLLGAAGAAALAIGAMAGPAMAAGSTASISYTCTTPLGVNATPSAVYSVKQAPVTMAVGQPLSTTAGFTLDAGTTTLAQTALKWASFTGTIKTTPSATKAGLRLSFPKTALGNGLAGATNATATGATLAGTKVGTFTFKLGDLGKVVLTGFDAGGTKLGQAIFPTPNSFGPCKNNAITTTLMSGATAVTTKVVKDTTTTKATAKYAPKTHVATGSATVKARFGTAATGKVAFTLKKGTHVVKTIKTALNRKGIAKAPFKGVKAKGSYSITAKYLGSASLKGSTGKATFKVS